MACCCLGQAYWNENQFDAAYAKFIKAIEIEVQKKNAAGIKHSLFFLSRFSIYRRNSNDIRKYFDEAESLPPSDPSFERLFALGKAYFSRMEKRFSEAQQCYLEGLRIIRDTHGVIHIPEILEGLAVLSETSEPEHAARLFVMAQALRERIGYQRAPDQQADFDSSIQQLRERLPQAEFERLWAEGQGMTVEQAVREAESLIS